MNIVKLLRERICVLEELLMDGMDFPTSEVFRDELIKLHKIINNYE